MALRPQRRHVLDIEPLEQRALLTAVAQFVSDLDTDERGYRAESVNFAVAGADTYQIVDYTRNTNRDFTRIGRIDADLQQSVRFEGSVGHWVVGDELYVSTGTRDGTSLWKTDGTEEGTTLLSEHTQIQVLASLNDKLYVREYSRTSETTSELLVIDPTSDEITRRPFEIQGYIDRLIHFNDQLYVDATTHDYTGRELWTIDDTEGELQRIDNFSFFAATESQLFLKDEDGMLWSSDGTDQGTYRLTGPSPDFDHGMVVGDRVLYYAGGTLSWRGSRNHDGTLWASDGTPDGTYQLTDVLLHPGSFGRGCQPRIRPVAIGDSLYLFVSEEGNHALWVSDGTREGTTRLAQQRLAPLAAADGMVYMRGYDDATGDGIWRTDGTPEGTVQLLDLVHGPDDLDRSKLNKGRAVASNGLLYFTTYTYDGVGDFDLWSIPLDTPPFRPLLGDSNRDGIFDSSDLVTVFQASKYENDTALQTTFDEGDWNGDGIFDSSDLVAAFKAGTYVAGLNPNDVVSAIDAVFTDEESNELGPQ